MSREGTSSDDHVNRFSVCPDHLAFIEIPEIRDAYRYMIGAAVCTGGYDCHFPPRGNLLVVEFLRDGKTPFSLNVNHKSLLFYFLEPAQASARYSRETLSQQFTDLGENSEGELKKRIVDLENARELAQYVFGF